MWDLVIHLAVLAMLFIRIPISRAGYQAWLEDDFEFELLTN